MLLSWGLGLELEQGVLLAHWHLGALCRGSPSLGSRTGGERSLLSTKPGPISLGEWKVQTVLAGVGHALCRASGQCTACLFCLPSG